MKVNAYIMKNGKQVLVVNSDKGETIFINKELIDYCFKNAKEPKQKKK